MAVRDSVRDYVLEQLAGLGAVRAKAMFGGYGLYRGDRFFGILYRDALYLKVDDTTRPRYEDAGMEPFRPFPGRRTTMQYYEVPAEVIEDTGELCRWAAAAIEAADARRGRATARKPARRGRQPGRRR